MKIASLIAALVATAALTAFGQEGVVQDVKHGAKKAGETVVRKTKQAVDGTAEKTSETTQKTHHKSRKSASKAKADTTEEQAAKIDLETPLPSPTP